MTPFPTTAAFRLLANLSSEKYSLPDLMIAGMPSGCVSEIAVNAPGRVWIERAGAAGMECHALPQLEAKHIEQLAAWHKDKAFHRGSELTRKLKVIDVLAEDVPALLKAIDGRAVAAGGEKRKLATAGAEVAEIVPDWRTKVLAVITNPSVAYLLILIGIYALIFEFSNPGLILPGVVGAICILIAMYAFQLLPVNYAGLALLLLGVAFMAAELWVASHGALAVGGLVAFVIGSIMLLDTDVPQFEIPYTLIGGVTVASAAFVFLVLGMLMRSRRRPVVSGREYLIGAQGEALEDIAGEGWARVQGERWRVRADAPLKAGERLRITGAHGLLLDATRDTAAH